MQAGPNAWELLVSQKLNSFRRLNLRFGTCSKYAQYLEKCQIRKYLFSIFTIGDFNFTCNCKFLLNLSKGNLFIILNFEKTTSIWILCEKCSSTQVSDFRKKIFWACLRGGGATQSIFSEMLHFFSRALVKLSPQKHIGRLSSCPCSLVPTHLNCHVPNKVTDSPSDYDFEARQRCRQARIWRCRRAPVVRFARKGGCRCSCRARWDSSRSCCMPRGTASFVSRELTRHRGREDKGKVLS